jgi:hypothetical protein
VATAQKKLDTGDVARWGRLLRRNVNHHGKSVRATVPKIVGYILLYHDEGTLQVSAGAKYSNFGIAEFNGRRLAFSYSHEVGSIRVKDGGLRGQIIAQFNDQTGDMEILRFFRNLVGGRV